MQPRAKNASSTRRRKTATSGAAATGIKQLGRMANTLSLHREGLLAYYDVPISTGPLEGTNTKIKLLQRQSYGYRDQDFFRLRIFALHETRYELVG